MNQTMVTCDPNRTLLHRFLHWEAHTPNEIYLTQPYLEANLKESVVDYSWAEVGRQARSMAAYLRTLDLPSGSSIALLGKNSAHWIMADLAIWMAGHVSVPIYPTLNAETTSYIVRHADVKLVFVGKIDGKSDGWTAAQQGIPPGLPIVSLPLSPCKNVAEWDVLIGQREPLQDLPDPEPGQVATIIFTSGSTGNPKGAMHTFGSMVAAAVSLGRLYEMSQHERMLSYLPLAHVAERAAVEANSLYFGFRVFFTADLSTFQADVKRARPTMFFSVPRLWTRFYLGVLEKIPQRRQRLLFSLPIVSGVVKKIILSGLGLDQTRTAVTGSAPLPPHIHEWFRNIGLELLDAYGMTENFAVSHASCKGAVRTGYVGTPVPDVLCRIADDGEILVKSPGQMLGYWKQSGLNTEYITADGYFHTGDRGEIDAQGRLRITGRSKEQFKTSKGEYVAPAPIEQMLAEHPYIEAVCVLGSGQPQPFGLLTLSQDAQHSIASGVTTGEAASVELAALLDTTNSKLAPHERLSYVTVVNNQWTVESGFLTPTLKIKRHVIEERYLQSADAWLARHQKVIWE